jgi:hypothetical protein
MGQAAGLQEMVSPSKIFQNIITGNLDQGNKILIATKEISDLFEKEDILENLATAKEKEIKKNLKTKRKLFKNLFGFCLLISLTPSQRTSFFSTLRCRSGRRRGLLRISFSKIRFPFLNRLIPELGDELRSFAPR